jgi:glycosyltransferase involved in cell wall biosynthesis
VALNYSDKEILVVDDSTDSTPQIVLSYADRGVKLIHPGGGGRCEARNLGIQQATGEIVCILNADVHLPTDFLDRISVHYRNGFDYVLVETKVSNEQDLFARFVGSSWAAAYNPQTIAAGTTMDWTEGYSCRREVALRAGLFPTGYIVPICAGEDGHFAAGLRKEGAKGKVDFDIVIEHVCPASYSEYWIIRKGRGSGSAECHRLLDRWSYPRLIAWNALKTLWTLLLIILVVPALAINWRYAGFSPKGRADTLPFLWAWLVEQAAFHVGEWNATFRMMRIEM